MPSVFGKDSKRKELISVIIRLNFLSEKKTNSHFQNLQLIYEKIEREQNIPLGDFPKIDRMQEILKNMVSYQKSDFRLFFFCHLGFY